MELDSARGLKAAVCESVIEPMATSTVMKSFGLSAQPTTGLAASPPTRRSRCGYPRSVPSRPPFMVRLVEKPWSHQNPSRPPPNR
jgi:hypothetical protein